MYKKKPNRRPRITPIRRDRPDRPWISVVAAVALVAAGLIGWGVYESQRPDSYSTPAAATATGDGLALGDGPVRVDVYLDLLCPACKQFEATSAATLDRLVDEGRITLVYHPIAILDGASSTKYSTRAAAAVAAAADTGKLAAYLEALYAAQPPEGGPGLGDDELIRIAGSVGITDPAFATAVRSGKYRDWVAHVTEVADGRGLRSTPTVLVDGAQVNPRPDDLAAAVGRAS